MQVEIFKIRLSKLAASSRLVGRDKGRLTYLDLDQLVAEQTDQEKYEISFRDISLIDASFLLYSVLPVIHQYAGQRFFVLSELASDDLLDNVKAAASERGQPVVVLHQGALRTVGPNLSRVHQSVFKYLSAHRRETTASIAEQLEISLQSAGNHLTRMVKQGVIVRHLGQAERGGREYSYSTVL
ncbi:MAG: hypothetical protein JJ957_13710 [Pseudomonadales bacterium]|nr:hypothetical protein [Pseudomonadales bacterium]MBO6596626.1 hypothetical protein [Pseudomonadales bacterium]MBO6823385.1 hypothetical protein [Pseudomonadales bacterium]